MSTADPLPKEPLSPAEITRVKDFMGDAVVLDSDGAWERELAYAAAALAEPDNTGRPLDLSGLDARLDALDPPAGHEISADLGPSRYAEPHSDA